LQIGFLVEQVAKVLDIDSQQQLLSEVVKLISHEIGGSLHISAVHFLLKILLDVL